ncbi:MAG TPA: GAF domain-containing protein [Thermomicrobiales bacterium]|nr:GAF domain-containing protein [Thermomicrobiales bacterium]
MTTSTGQQDLNTGWFLPHIHDAVLAIDADTGQIILWNPAAERLFGYVAAEALGLSIEALVPERLRLRHRAWRAGLGTAGHSPFLDPALPRDLLGLRKTGEEIPVQITLSPVEEGTGGRHYVLALVHDLSEQAQVASARALQIRARQQAAIATLGQRALAGADLDALTDEAAAVVAAMLEVEFCKVLELLPDDEALLLRSGVGWQEGYVGRAIVGADTDSPAGYTLRSSEPVIVHDLRTETRFSGPPLMTDHGVVSGITAIIHGRERPFGVLGADTTAPRTFTRDDIHFLQAAANVLATAIERKRAEEERERLLHGLGERVKELALLHQVARLLHQEEMALDDVLQTATTLLPAAYQHPDVAEARIEFAGSIHTTSGFAPSPWRQEVAFATAGGRAGRVTVVYRETRPVADQGPFLAEEQAMLDSVAEMLRAYLGRREMEQALRASEERYRSAFADSAMGHAMTTLDGRFIEVNRAFCGLIGYTEAELLTIDRLAITHPDDRAVSPAFIRQLIAGAIPRIHLEKRYIRRDGSVVPVLVDITPVRDAAGTPLALMNLVQDITQPKRIEEERQTRARQQAAVAEFGRVALATPDLSAVLDEAVGVAARVLGVEYCQVLEFQPDGRSLLLRAGSGWREDLVGQATVPAGRDSQAGYTLVSDGPVIVEDLCAEARFGAAPLLREHGIVSGLSAAIGGLGRPFGVLGAHTTRRRTFTPDDAHFLEAVANVLTTAIERTGAEEERARLIQEQAARKQAEAAQRQATFLAEASGQLAGSLAYEATLQRAARLAIPGLADWCTVMVVQDDLPAVGLAVAHTDPAVEEAARALLLRCPFRPRATYGIAKVLRTGEPELYPEVSDALLMRRARDAGERRFLRSLGLVSAMILPLVAHGRTLGVLTLASAASCRRYGPAELALAGDLAGRVALALDNALLYEQQGAMVDRLQQLRGQLEAAERDRLLDSERRRIARELHDRVEQTFFGIALGAEAALGTTADTPALHLREVLASVRSLASAGAEELREAIFALNRAEMHEPGLLPLLWGLVRDFQRRTGVEADLVLAEAERRVPREAGETLHAVAREALTNVERHAQAGAVVLSLRFDKQAATLTIQDDGVGISPLILHSLDSSATRFGLRNSRERVQHLGGSFTVRPGHDGGTIVSARVPLDDRDRT